MEKISVKLGGKEATFEVNAIAKQADASVLARYGDNVVLVTLCAANEPRGGDFLPLTVDYIEKTYAAGKIPGGFFKREGRPSEREVLTSRLIDRPVRALIPDRFGYETQIIATVLAADGEIHPGWLAMTGASVALSVSDVPFEGPMASIQVAKVGGELICNPTFDQLENNDLDLMVASTEQAIVMVEGGANELSEEEVLEALMFAFESAQPVIQAQKELQAKIGKTKRELLPDPVSDDLRAKVSELIRSDMEQKLNTKDKLERYSAVRTFKKQTVEKLLADGTIAEGEEGLASLVIGEVQKQVLRGWITNERRRVDGRDETTVRPIACETSYLPRTHGSALFTRGETQALVVATLGTGDDEQRIDGLHGDTTKKFMLHYNFPPFCVGETKFLRSPGRREIGHGVLAERALARVLPLHDEFPYTVRLVSEVLESNGSSSMATVCGGSLALMDAGVPIRSAVAGVAMGLIKEGDAFHILTDILGDEDHLGDMDFKVAGTDKGITALQMDIKITGVSREILQKALSQAADARQHVLQNMESAISSPRESVSAYAPRIHTLQINTEKIGTLIGPGGKMIRSIVDETGVKIDVDDTGRVMVFSSDEDSMQQAVDIIEKLVEEPEIGRTYEGKVRRITDFGAFVEIIPGTDGLVHISQLGAKRIESVRDEVSEGDMIKVKILDIDREGKVRLSRREVLRDEGHEVEEAPDRPPRDRNRGGSGPRRDGGRGRDSGRRRD